MENKNQPAFPDTMRAAPQSYLNQNPEQWPTGLTKREYFASFIDVNKDFENYSATFLEEISGLKKPDPKSSALDIYEWQAAVEAKMKTIKADALLSELEK